MPSTSTRAVRRGPCAGARWQTAWVDTALSLLPRSCYAAPASRRAWQGGVCGRLLEAMTMKRGGPSLRIKADDGRDWEVPLGAKQPLLISRSPEADVPLVDDTVSRRHAELFRDPFGRWCIRDLGSRN